MGRMLVFGDSIAYGKWDNKGGWAARLRRYIDENYNIDKSGNIQIFNLSIPSELVVTSVSRIKQDALSRNFVGPKLAIIALGLNDSCSNNSLVGKKTPEKEFSKTYLSIIDFLKHHRYKVISIGLTPVNPSKSKRLAFTNEDAKIYDQLITQVCKQADVPKLEIFDKLADDNFSDLLVDAAHPNNKGHEILFSEILQFLMDNKYIDYLNKE